MPTKAQFLKAAGKGVMGAAKATPGLGQAVAAGQGVYQGLKPGQKVNPVTGKIIRRRVKRIVLTQPTIDFMNGIIRSSNRGRPHIPNVKRRRGRNRF